MKLIELLEKQKLIIQLSWGEQMIEFDSSVISKDNSAVYVSPYLYNGSELELNVTQGKGVICNVFTNDPSTNKRISWKNVELSTVIKTDKTLYCIKTNGYNHISKDEDRRMHDRIIIHQKAVLVDGQFGDTVDIIVHDISDIGISFFAPKTFTPKDYQLTVKFTDIVGGRAFNIKVECSIARRTQKAGNQFYGCRIIKDNKDYQLYSFMKRLEDKNKNKISNSLDNEQPAGNKSETEQPSLS